MSNDKIPTTGNRTTLASSLATFLKDNPSLHLGGDVDFHSERRHHLEVFGRHNLPEDKRAPVGKVEFTAVRGPHGTIPIRLFYRKNVIGGKKTDVAALIYFHGSGYTVGSVDEFENVLRILAEEAVAVVSPFRYPRPIHQLTLPPRQSALTTALPPNTPSPHNQTNAPP